MVGLITSQKNNNKFKNNDLEQTNELLYLSRMKDQEALSMLLNLYLPTISFDLSPLLHSVANYDDGRMGE